MKRTILLWISLALMVTALYLIFVIAPIERTMGIVQKIFYLMVPMGWLALLSFLVVFIGSILYLKKRSLRWDILSYSSAEVGVIFTTLALVTGSIWAKPAWGVWWTWEPRLTATLVLWLIYLTYFMVRSFATEESRGATFAAIVGIIGFIDIPIIVLATTLWRGLHPGALIFQGGLDPTMLLTLIISLLTFSTLYALILMQRISLKNNEVEIKRMKELSQPFN
ncbi:MAG: cytochrome c biogenesis protein [Dehalococcoidales bacterium]|jgi:heme exporter protein C|nr:cytochrome c biogenesis protein [Dehalococcoidales bacterium]MDP7416214.1 cytochrome c biogenesis protein [Dehalococcoidales bacterium]